MNELRPKRSQWGNDISKKLLFKLSSPIPRVSSIICHNPSVLYTSLFVQNPSGQEMDEQNVHQMSFRMMLVVYAGSEWSDNTDGAGNNKEPENEGVLSCFVHVKGKRRENS